MRLAETATLSLVRSGDRVDLVSVDQSGGRVAAIADDALVLAVAPENDPSMGGLLLALNPTAAHRAVGAAERARFAVLVRPNR